MRLDLRPSNICHGMKRKLHFSKGGVTDTVQIIEGMHSYVDKSMKKSGHWSDDSSTILCGLKQHEGVLKINAFSINLKWKILLMGVLEN